MLSVAVQLPHAGAACGSREIRSNMFAKTKRSEFERVGVVIWRWISFSGSLVVPAPGLEKEKLVGKFPPLQESGYAY